MTSAERRPPLSHVRVLDLSRMYPGAFCSLLLADLGADVVKVEGPGSGDGMRAMAAPGAFNAAHTALNRGKRSMVLDLRNPDAAAVLKRMVRGVDVVIESHRPGQLDGLGLGYEAMSADNERLVWCSITGFGDFGPNVAAPGHDITYLGYSGLMSKLSSGPASPPGAVISLPAAALMGAVGILSALAQVRGSLEATVTSRPSAQGYTLRAAEVPQPGRGSVAARVTSSDRIHMAASTMLASRRHPRPVTATWAKAERIPTAPMRAAAGSEITAPGGLAGPLDNLDMRPE